MEGKANTTGKETDTSFDSTVESEIDSSFDSTVWSEIDLERDENLVAVAIPLDNLDDASAGPNIEQGIKSLLCRNIIPDEWLSRLHMGRFKVIESIEVVRMIKFVWVSILSILSMHVCIRKIGWEHDEEYTIQDFISFDLGSVVLDTGIFAVISRVYQRDGVDRLSFLLPMIISIIYGSWSTEIWFLKNSITLHNLEHTWPWQLFLFAGIIIIIIFAVVGLHVSRSFRDGSLIQKFVEMSLLAILFILPGSMHEAFHLHHWASFWLLGMLFSRLDWWSQLSMAICWGQYLNGISVWGRDSILTSD
jgi:hypothetical protein